MNIRRARPEDAGRLAEIAERIFRETFAKDNRAEDIEAYVRLAYGEARQRREIEDPRHVALLAEEDGALIAFAQMQRDDAAVEILRFYVDPLWHGRGVAHELMRAAEAAARASGATTLRLGVWEHNARAIAFYAKCGFRDTGTQPFLLGSDLQTDRVMEKEL